MAVLTPEQEASVRTQFAPGGQSADAKPKVTTVVQRVVKHLKQLLGLPIIPVPGDDSSSNTTTPSNP